MILSAHTAAILQRIQRTKAWALPLAWILITPLVTVPMTWVLTSLIFRTSACVAESTNTFYSYTDVVCRNWALAIALVPGLINLLPVVWAASPERWMRIGARVATMLGIARVLVPAGALLLTGPTQTIDTSFFDLPHWPNEDVPVVGWLSSGLWLVSAAALPLIAIFRAQARSR